MGAHQVRRGQDQRCLHQRPQHPRPLPPPRPRTASLKSSTMHVLPFLTSENCVRHCYSKNIHWMTSICFEKESSIGNFIFQLYRDNSTNCIQEVQKILQILSTPDYQ